MTDNTNDNNVFSFKPQVVVSNDDVSQPETGPEILPIYVVSFDASGENYNEAVGFLMATNSYLAFVNKGGEVLDLFPRENVFRVERVFEDEENHDGTYLGDNED